MTGERGGGLFLRGRRENDYPEGAVETRTGQDQPTLGQESLEMGEVLLDDGLFAWGHGLDEPGRTGRKR